jgi:hypothetical protein
VLTALPTWTAETSIYQWSRYSYCAPAAGLSSAWPQSLGLLGQALPSPQLPCGTCGPCLPDETSFTGCTEICWTRRPPGGTCDEYDRPCRGRGCKPVCPIGSTLCATGCVNIDNDPANCGSCGNICPQGTTCCGGACVDTSTDPHNCGTCGVTCPKGINGNDPACCGSSCVDTSVDENNCGGCSKKCPAGVICCNSGCGGTNCGNGICCPPPFSKCGGPFKCW